jgi:hypothetical protein
MASSLAVPSPDFVCRANQQVGDGRACCRRRAAESAHDCGRTRRDRRPSERSSPSRGDQAAAVEGRPSRGVSKRRWWACRVSVRAARRGDAGRAPARPAALAGPLVSTAGVAWQGELVCASHSARTSFHGVRRERVRRDNPSGPRGWRSELRDCCGLSVGAGSSRVQFIRSGDRHYLIDLNPGSSDRWHFRSLPG